MIKLNKILVVDLESTCFDDENPKTNSILPDLRTKKSEIIELGIALLDIKSGTVEDSDSFYVQNQFNEISEFCTNLTGITQELLNKKGVLLHEALRRLTKKYNPQNKYWASYGEYDLYKLKSSCIDFGIEYPFSNHHINVKHLFSFKHKMSRGIGLRKALDQMNIEFVGNQHCGKDDAVNTAILLKELLK